MCRDSVKNMGVSASVGTAAGTPKAKLKLSEGFTRTRDGFLIKKEAVSDSGGVRTYLGLPFPLSPAEGFYGLLRLARRRERGRPSSRSPIRQIERSPPNPTHGVAFNAELRHPPNFRTRMVRAFSYRLGRHSQVARQSLADEPFGPMTASAKDCLQMRGNRFTRTEGLNGFRRARLAVRAR